MSNAFLAKKANEWGQTKNEESIHKAKLLNLLKCSDPKNSCARNMMVGIFFDGTGNSREVDFPKRMHTNIARLAALHPDKREQGFHQIYLQGVGTRFKEIDDVGAFDLIRGSAFGKGGMKRINFAYIALLNRISRHFTGEDAFDFKMLLEEGIRNRPTTSTGRGVRTAEEARKLTESFKNNFSVNMAEQLLHDKSIAPLINKLQAGIGNKKHMLDTINIAVFGFSRGAAQARAFLNHFPAVFPGGKIAGYKVNIYFAGLMDTVSSVGLVDIFNSGASGMDGFYDWAKNPRVRPDKVKELYHFVALNEVRSCFPLTALGDFKDGQYAYPGVHSDVGGGYGSNFQGKRDISVVPGRHMYFLARRAGVPLMGLDEAKESIAKSAAQAFKPNPATDKAFDGFLAVMEKLGFPAGKTHHLVAMANVANIEYLKHRGYILNTFEQQPFYQRTPENEQRAHLKIVNDHLKKVIASQSAVYRAAKSEYERIVSLKKKAFPSEAEYIGQMNPFSKLVLNSSKDKLQPSLHNFYSDYVHDSVASFIGMAPKGGQWVTTESNWNGMGILKVRSIYAY